LLACILLAGGAFGEQDAAGGDRTITKVIKMLQGMLVKSKADGEKDVKLFAKYKCYCDSNAAEKKQSIEDNGKMMELLAGEIMALQAENGKLSSENAALEMAMGDNERARTTADELRSQANTDFVAEESDMKAAIGQMDQAIDTLAAIGADQTAAKASLMAKDKFMGHESSKASLIKVAGSVKDALKAASVFLSSKDKNTLTSFIQAPFTGTYQSQSGEIVGILKNMRDTFKSNLASARASENASSESHTKFSTVKSDEFDKMKGLYEDKEKILGQNDDTLSTKKTSKGEAESTKADDEDFLGKLQRMCIEKTRQFEDRKMVRANEEAAVSEAVSILNSDEAFETMGAVKATSTGATSLLQTGLSQERLSVREQVQKELARAAKQSKSLKLAKIAVSLEVGNPFEKVVKELDDMVALIAREEVADDDQKAWCDSEREENHDQLSSKTTSKGELEGKHDTLVDTIDNEESGLKAQLAEQNTKLGENRRDQAEEIEDRGLENAAYQGNIVNLNNAANTLDKALKVLKKFYDWLHAKQGPHHYDKKAGKDSGSANLKRIPEASVEELEEACSNDPGCAGFNSNGWLKASIDDESKWYDGAGDLYVKVYDESNPVLIQADPAPPEAFGDEGTTDGQSGQATDAVSMLGFILKETREEEKQAHTDEESSQHTFEDSMSDLKTQEGACLDTIADLSEQLSEKEKTLEETKIDLEKTTNEKKALERYLLKIKPGCDFITDNIDTRKDNRKAETEALGTATSKLKGTPAYKAAAAAVEKEQLGKCADKCAAKSSIACKACVAGVSETGYCAGHADDAGC